MVQEVRSVKHTSKVSVPNVWPVIVALGLVALLIVGMFVVEYFITRHVASHVDHLVENTQQSIILLDDIRSKAQNLGKAGLSPDEKSRLVVTIARDARAYDPLTTSIGEPEEWRNLQDLLARLASTPLDDQAARGQLANEIDTSIEQLVSINAKEGVANAVSVRRAHARVLVSDELIAGITLALVVVISIVLFRVLARQRQLVVERFALLDDRTRDLEAFAGRAAHDLRSPMNPIRGYADLLLETTSPEDVAMMARRIRTAVDRMARVVDDMLALSIAGRPAPGSSRPGAVAVAVLEEMGADLHGVDVTTKFAAVEVACSSGLLHQILRNLISNALKFRARDRPLHVTIESREVDSMVEIVIQDNGVGMDAETTEHALEPLYRGRMGREVPGHGLGLAIVDRAARSLGGTCELSSVLDEGTRVAVRLPRA
jgi:signal transduction histidine kinase